MSKEQFSTCEEMPPTPKHRNHDTLQAVFYRAQVASYLYIRFLLRLLKPCLINDALLLKFTVVDGCVNGDILLTTLIRGAPKENKEQC